MVPLDAPGHYDGDNRFSGVMRHGRREAIRPLRRDPKRTDRRLYLQLSFSKPPACQGPSAMPLQGRQVLSRRRNYNLCCAEFKSKEPLASGGQPRDSAATPQRAPREAMCLRCPPSLHQPKPMALLLDILVVQNQVWLFFLDLGKIRGNSLHPKRAGKACSGMSSIFSVGSSSVLQESPLRRRAADTPSHRHRHRILQAHGHEFHLGP